MATNRTLIAALVLLGTLASGGCTTTSDVLSSASPTPYSIRCEPRSDLASASFRIIGCTVRNLGPQPLTLRAASAQLRPDSPKNQVALGADYPTDAVLQQDADKAAADAAAGAVAVGVVIAVTGGNGGGIPAAGAATASAARARLRPDGGELARNPLLGEPFTVAPDASVTKYLAVKAAKDSLRPDGVLVCVEVPVSECLALTFVSGERARIGNW